MPRLNFHPPGYSRAVTGEQQPAPDATRREFTFEAMTESARTGGWKRVPALTLAALAMVWRAAPRQLVTTTLLQIVAAAALMAQLLVGRELVQRIIAVRTEDGGVGELVPEFALLVLATTVAGLVAALIDHQRRLLTELVARYAFAEIIETATSVSLASFEDPSFHDQLQRAKTSGLQRPVVMVQNVVTLGTAALSSAGVAIVLVSLEPILLPLVVLAGLPLLLASIANSRRAYQFEWGFTAHARERFYLMGLLTERESAKELRAFDAMPFLRSRYDDLTEERVRELRRFLRRRLGTSLTGAIGTAIGTAIAVGSLVVLLAEGRIDASAAVAAGVSMQLLASRGQSIIGGLASLIESGMFLDDFQTFMRLGEQERRRAYVEEGDEPAGPRFDGVRVEAASFAYPGTDRTVIDDVSVEIGTGEIVALVGENGSGKTTLVKLICGLYRPDGGQVLWNGRDLSDLDGRTVRDNVTVLFQDFVQYHLTVADNIALGRVGREATPEALEEAARLAGAHDLIQRLPDSYTTRLGRQFWGGHELSIGQWQRLALARAFFRGGDFLILDEPTAALDPRAEHELFEHMRRLAAGRSLLLISHRFSSVRGADRIYVMHRGRVVEVGSHDELLRQDGHYAELFRLQAQAHLAREGA